MASRLKQRSEDILTTLKGEMVRFQQQQQSPQQITGAFWNILIMHVNLKSIFSLSRLHTSGNRNFCDTFPYTHFTHISYYLCTTFLQFVSCLHHESISNRDNIYEIQIDFYFKNEYFLNRNLWQMRPSRGFSPTSVWVFPWVCLRHSVQWRSFGTCTSNVDKFRSCLCDFHLKSFQPRFSSRTKFQWTHSPNSRNEPANR